MMTDSQRQVVSFVFAVLVFGSSVLGFVAIGADVARADIGQQGCLDDAGAFVLSPLLVTYSNWQDGCWKADTEAEIDAQMDLNQTYDEAIRVADVRANEERLIDSLLTTKQFAKTPVRDEAELVFAQEYVNGSTETESITAARNVVDSEYDERHKSLVGKYNRDVRNARDTYTQLDTEGAPELLHVYVDGTEVVPTDGNGVTFSVPTSLNDSANGTAYTVSGETVYVATVTVDGTAYTFENNISVTIEDPAGELSEVPLVGYDYETENPDAGAKNYQPPITPAEADVVVDDDGTGDYTTVRAALDAVSSDTVIYVKAGEYTGTGQYKHLNFPSIGNITIYGEGEATHIRTPYADRPTVYTNEATGQIRIEGVRLSGATDHQAVIKHYSGYELVMKDVTITGSVASNYNQFQSDGSPFTTTDVIAYDTTGGWQGPSDKILDVRYLPFTSELIAEQEADRTEILTAFGDSSSGYLSDVWAQLQTGVLTIQDILNYDQMFSQSFSEEDVGSLAYIDGQYMQAGMSSHASNYTVVVEAQTGSMVYANAQRSQSATVSTPIEYRGHIWTMNPPAGGTWEANTTYDTETLGSPVFVTYWKTTTQLDGEGNLVTSTEPATVAIEGEFRITELVAEDGSSVQTIDHSGTPSADPYDASTYADDIEQLNQRIADLKQQLEDFTDSSGTGDGEGDGSGPDACGIELPLFGCTGITSMNVSLIALAIITLGVAYVLGPALRGLGGLLNR
jgi:hypothetical protein